MAVKAGRLALEAAVAGAGSFGFLVLLILLRATRVLWMVAIPVLYLGGSIAHWINVHYPPQGGGWFEGLGTIILVEAMLVWIMVWACLFFALQVFKALKSRRENV